ncbi:P-loop NTPase fold protein [Nocardia sp. NPDC058666]|uniref:KAP family P-loop NTPase fold protein n=1 Tax=Nocardia sp. NPDC058666 TaxID=3346587 RepID=UPI0036460558
MTYSALFSDAPITDESKDRLGRDKFAAHIAARISEANLTSSTVFGLSGPWGGGKTSLLHLIEKHIPSAWEIVHFTPWAAGDPTSVIAEFYAAIASAFTPPLRKKAKELFSSALGYGADLAAATIPVAGDLASNAMRSAGGALSDNAKPFDERFGYLSDRLQKEELVILVIVDDLDRLHADELLTVLKAVRLLGNFPGIHYLLSYDQQTVCDVLTRTPLAYKDNSRALQYLEKIVQYPFEVPPLQESHRDREIYDLIGAIASRHGVGADQEDPSTLSRIRTFLDLVPDGDLATLRAIHRLTNQFDVVLTTIGPAEVNFEDLLYLTYLRVTYPSLYAQFQRWKPDLTRKVVNTGTSGRDPIDWKIRIKEQLPGAPDHIVTSLHGILHYVFPHLDDTTRSLVGIGRQNLTDYRMVRERDYFDRYLSFTIPDDDISDSIVGAELAGVAQSGALADDSPLTLALRNNALRRITLNKCRKIATTVNFSTESATSAAIRFTRLLDIPIDENPVYSPATYFVALLLSEAIRRADSNIAKLGAVEDYCTNFDLRVATMVITSMEGAHSGEFDVALTEHRKRQVETCIADLDSQSSASERERRILFHWSILDEPSRERVRNHVVTKYASEWAGVVHVASKFFIVQNRLDGQSVVAEFSWGDFESVFPRNTWPPFVPRSDDHLPLNQTDLSQENLNRMAHRYLAESVAE